MNESLLFYMVAVVLQFVIGLACLMIKRDMVRLLIGIEILFNAANLSFMGFSLQTSGHIDPFAHSIIMMAIVLDGTVIAVGLAMTLNVYKHYKTINIRKLRRLKW
ncbi:NADH-quinone oxidoreductase subunit NuoK [Candidatus Bathyarchaeota archaeon]|nr:NADH-quinone oxidoreductase subunit NuoK [Candidatus Bathyarchaeota archaeon]MBS7629938.1 NADH-quinone oxidoreductase subunit NuoK [Candidatus Bathyarchaeota archaeon]MBS7630023.1 NADH-quinone oxidoreductase subunit NuoK [Candidatus Bathyarchaeota archaeon]